MVVKKRANVSMESFIDKGADVKANKEGKFKSILLRLPQEILDDLDAYLLLSKPWLPRTQWIVEAIHERLKKIEG